MDGCRLQADGTAHGSTRIPSRRLGVPQECDPAPSQLKGKGPYQVSLTTQSR